MAAAGADPNALDKKFSTPLDLARSARLLRTLQAAGSRFGKVQEGIFVAIAEGSTAEVEALLDAGVALECRSELGDTPALFAARADRHQALERLAARGADLGARSQGGKTALHLAATHVATVAGAWLLEQAVEIDALDDEGRTPLMDLLDGLNNLYPKDKRSASEKFVERLAAAGASLNLAAQDRRTCLERSSTKRLANALQKAQRR